MADFDAYFIRSVIEEEKNELIRQAQSDLWKCAFWRNIFYELLDKHSYQEEFYLVGKKPTQSEVEVYLHNVLKKLRAEYKIKCRRLTTKNDIILDLWLCYDLRFSKKDQNPLQNEISIRVTHVGIFLEVLPYSSLTRIFRLDEYLIVEKIIIDYCNIILTSPDIHLTDFITYRKNLEEDVQYLTVKTIDIAQSSIKSLYEKSEQKFKQITQSCLFSKLMIDGEEICIRHKEFLDNPQILIQKLQKKSK